MLTRQKPSGREQDRHALGGSASGAKALENVPHDLVMLVTRACARIESGAPSTWRM